MIILLLGYQEHSVALCSHAKTKSRATYFRSVSLLLALRFAISQAGIAVRTRMMESFKEKELEHNGNRTHARDLSDTCFNH